MLLIEEKEEDVLSHSTAVHLTTRTWEIKMTPDTFPDHKPQWKYNKMGDHRC